MDCSIPCNYVIIRATNRKAIDSTVTDLVVRYSVAVVIIPSKIDAISGVPAEIIPFK